MKRKILMVTMGLDIGGAETHIMELSRELVRRGWDVLIASNGGVYVEAAEAAGIRHFSMPLHDRSAAHMAHSYRALKELIQRERPDVVHAHARIPAFLTGLVRRRVPFNFVTSAHWVFHVTPLNRRLTDWGQYTVAVSEDIRQYLIDEYQLAAEQISVTINGIDTDTFSPDTGREAIVQEFSLEEGAPVISYVSRLDESRALVARQLIAVAPALAERIPGVQILIAGGGDVFEELREQAARVNETLGRRCLILTGPRTDIHRIVAAGDVFVGVSRAALEAMSAAKPVIVAGNEGYIGPFTEKELKVGQETNFCCRGCPLSTEERLLRDLEALFALSAEERQAMGQYGREVVLAHYSVRRMTDDYCAVYEVAMQPRIQVLMSGYFGFRNPGDEAILSSTYDNIRSLGGNIAVQALIYKPQRAAGQYPFGMVDRFRPRKVWRALRQCDILLSGGGSLLQDSTSHKSIWYYLAILRLAELLKKKVVLYSNGIGPVRSRLNRRLVRNVVERADLVTLRDENSAKELEKMGVQGPPLHVTADAVFTYDKEPMETLPLEGIFAAEGIPLGRPFAGVSVRSWKTASEDFPQRVAQVCDYISRKYGLMIVFVVMQHPADLAASRAILEAMETEAYMLESRYSPGSLMTVMGAARLMLCMRLHALIFAADRGVPSLGMVYDPKVRDYLKLLGMPSLGDVENLDVQHAREQVDHLMASYEQYVTALRETHARLSRAAERNVELLKELIDEYRK